MDENKVNQIEENKEFRRVHRNSVSNFPKELSLSPITMRDLLLFKEDILKEMKIYESNTNLSITKNFEKYNKLLEECNEKLYNYQRDNALFMKQITFIEERDKIINLINEKNAENKNQCNVNDLLIRTYQKEFENACFKYDKVIMENLLIPGIVGKSCKFPYLKDYLNDIQKQINNAISQNKQMSNNLSAYRNTIDGQIRQSNLKIKQLETESKQFTSEKTIYVDNKYNEICETLNKQFNAISCDFLKNKYELKNRITEVKNIKNTMIEEDKKINVATLVQFEKIKKQFKKFKKNIVELSTLLTQGVTYTGKGKYNRNIANNRQLIIQQFNSMIIGLMKDVTKDKAELNSEINNVLFPKKKVGSVIKKYIEGKIHADDTKYDEKDRNSKLSSNRFEAFSRHSVKKKNLDSFSKNYDLKISSSKVNSDFGKTIEKKSGKQLSVEFKDISYNNTINNTEPKMRSLFDEKNKINIIKEEKNIRSNDSSDSFLYSDKDDNNDNDEAMAKKVYSKYFNDKNSFLNSITEKITPTKDKKKNFLRASTQNYNNKIFNNLRKTTNPEGFKLLLKAQENITKKNTLEKKLSMKYEEMNKNIDKNKKDEIKAISKTESSEIKSIMENKNINKSISSENKNIKENKTLNKKESSEIKNIKDYKDKSYDKNKNEESDYKTMKVAKSEKKSNFLNLSKKEDNKNEENTINKNIEKKMTKENMNNKNEEINKIKSEESPKNINLKKEEKPIIIKENHNKRFNNDYASPRSINTTNLTNMKSNLQIIQLSEVSKPSSSYKNKTISTESNIMKYSKNANNKNNNNNKALILKKDKMICFTSNFSNNLIKNSNKNPSHDDNINKDKKESLSSTKIKRPLSIMNSCQTRPINKFKIKKKYNIFDDEIYLNKDTIKTLNYCRDENIIDKPLIINQTDFRVDNVKGSLENKILELEYFTKRKLDELVKEIKNFIPIHFNAYLRE